jgi:hypothetical protein
MTSEVIRNIRERQEAYDKDPEGYERREKQREEEREQERQAEQEYYERQREELDD